MEESPRVAFRGNVEAEILRRINAERPHRRLDVKKHEVEGIGLDSGLSESDACRVFFLLAGEVWVGEVIGGPKHGHPAIAHMAEPEDWLGVALDVPWFQRQGKAPTPLP